MNEKINSLRQEAWRYANNYVGDDIGVKSQLQRFEEKFAELLLKDAARFVDSQISDNGYGVADGWCQGKDLLEHFGVK